ncbi:MAG: site-specific DNA-methyltransferase [Patescibacteria group bacterium]
MNNIIINDDFRNHLNLFDGNAYIISDPPYNQHYHYSQYLDNLELKEYLGLINLAFNNRKSIIIHYPEETVNIISRAMGLNWCEESVAWVYNSNTAKQHRQITWWNCKPDFKRIRQPYKNPTDKRIKKRIEEGKQAKLYDWWEINQVKNVSKKLNPHPCPIPYLLAERLVILTTNPGDLIIDPFAGSGTILLAAKNNNRNYIGFEIDKTYFDYAQNILERTK